MSEQNTSGHETSTRGEVWEFEPILAKLDQLEALQAMLAAELAPAPAESEIAAAADLPAGEVETLAWSLLDGAIDRDQMTRLETLLRTDDAAVKTYVECALLHADLHQFFAPPSDASHE